jgi:hypothetical protein
MEVSLLRNVYLITAHQCNHSIQQQLYYLLPYYVSLFALDEPILEQA